jgi:tetratricopeptide (TPR) repeat protein
MGVPSLGMLLFFAGPVDCTVLPAHESAYEESFRSCPRNAALDAAYSSLLIREGKFARALEVASAGDPANSLLILNQGVALYSLHRAQQSLQVLAKIDSAEAYFYTGLNYRLLARHNEAQSYLLKAWNAGYHDPFLLYSLIEEDHAAGDKKAGIVHFQLMLQGTLNPHGCTWFWEMPRSQWRRISRRGRSTARLWP